MNVSDFILGLVTFCCGVHVPMHLYHPYWSDWLSCKQTNLTSTYGVLWVIIISMSQKIIEYLEASNRNTTCVANVSKFSVYIKLLTKMNGMFLCSRPPRTYHFFKNRMSHWHIGWMGITGKNHKLWLLWYVNKICSWSGWNKIMWSINSIADSMLVATLEVTNLHVDSTQNCTDELN